MTRWLVRLLGWGLVMALVAGGASAWWLNNPVVTGNAPLDLAIEAGTAPRAVAKLAVDSGVQAPPWLLFAWFKLSGLSRQIKAGSYELEPGTTPYSLLQKLARGEASMRAVTLVEGWNMRQLRAALAKADALKPDSATLSDADLMAQLGRPGQAPEGRFFPDTYTYAKGSSDLALLKRALKAMDKHLAEAWALRAADTPLRSPDELLTLASIVEKETGQPGDRPLIAGVFTNPLRNGMLLQTDPTVIYGLGTQFDGNLRKADLLNDTPYNTYTRAGLPPTPIAMPGKAALGAAVQPAATRALYFVARGDGSSEFSATLQEHNRAVNKFQRGQ